MPAQRSSSSLVVAIRLSKVQRSVMADTQGGSRCCRVLSDDGIMQEAITRDPEVMHGTPVFRGTRVPVQTLFDYLENGESLDDFLEGFPTIRRELAVEVLEECKELRLARV